LTKHEHCCHDLGLMCTVVDAMHVQIDQAASCGRC
jgi:hypothetical protein